MKEHKNQPLDKFVNIHIYSIAACLARNENYQIHEND